jgi:hypothetical protein
MTLTDTTDDPATEADAPEVKDAYWHQEQEEILVALGRHMKLTTDQIHRAVVPHTQIQWVRRLLGRLLDAKLVGRARPRRGKNKGNVPYVWWLTPKGGKEIEGSRGLRGAKPRVLTSRGIQAATEAHLLSTNEACITIITAARQHNALGSWNNEISLPTRDTVGVGKYLRADAELTIDDGQNALRVLLELDRGTETYDDLLFQTTQYLHLRSYKRAKAEHEFWKERWPPNPSAPLQGFPALLWCFDCPNADRRLLEFASRLRDPARSPQLAAAGGEDLWVLLTTLDKLKHRGAYAHDTFYDPYANVYVNIMGQQAENAA